MFFPGTKIMVVESSVKKTSGARVGSLGYFIDSQNGNYFSEINFFVQSCRIAFLRYGFEEKSRFEIKEFISFVPIKPDETAKRRTYKKWATKFLSGFGNDRLLEIAMNYSSNSPKSTCYGVLSPVSNPPVDLDSLDFDEWNIWATSILLSPQFQLLINNLSSPHGVNYLRKAYPVDQRWHGIFSHILEDKNLRRTSLRNLYKDKEAKREITEALRALMAVGMRHYYRVMLEQFSENLHAGRFRFNPGNNSGSDRAVSALVNFLFTPLRASVFTNAANVGSDELLKLTTNIQCWKDMPKEKLVGPDCSQPVSG